MPFKSKAQQRFMYATKPKLAKKWQKETPKNMELPDKVHEAVEAVLQGTPVNDVVNEMVERS